LKAPNAGAREAADAAWAVLWPAERRRQAAFHLFGMELLTRLDLGATDDFFRTFFALPPFYWRGFLASSLSSAQLVVFALLTFALAPLSIKARLVSHLATDPSGAYLARKYLGGGDGDGGSGDGSDGESGGIRSSSSSSSSAAAAVV
jgi:lycopene epsilon-cyclase